VLEIRYFVGTCCVRLYNGKYFFSTCGEAPPVCRENKEVTCYSDQRDSDKRTQFIRSLQFETGHNLVASESNVVVR